MQEDSQLNERSQKLLKLLVESYINEGQPIGSKALALKSSLAMSSATIRNVMADLEDAGFINSPHTSSGRVPTAKGYRFFVDELLNTKPLTNFDQVSLPPCADTRGLVASASSMLSAMTKLTGLVMLPHQDSAILQQIEFLPLSGNRVLVILVLDKNQVQNRIIYTDRLLGASELQEAGNFLTSQFGGKDLYQIRCELMSEVAKERNNITELTQAIVDMTNESLDERHDGRGDYVVAGEENLFDYADYSGVQKLRDLFAAFSQKRDILHLLNQCLRADGVKIYIGEETEYGPLNDCSMITSTYHCNDKVVGVLGVIGPTRMPYDQAIAAVDVTSRLLSAALSEIK